MYIVFFNSLEYLSKFETNIKEIGISGYTFWIGSVSKKLKWQTFTGPEKLIIFTNNDLVQLFPELENVVQIQRLWKDFLEIHQRYFSLKQF